MKGGMARLLQMACYRTLDGTGNQNWKEGDFVLWQVWLLLPGKRLPPVLMAETEEMG